MIRWPWRQRTLTPLQKAERASALAVPTQAVGHVRAARRRATLGGLLASIPADKSATILAKLAEAERAR